MAFEMPFINDFSHITPFQEAVLPFYILFNATESHPFQDWEHVIHLEDGPYDVTHL